MGSNYIETPYIKLWKFSLDSSLMNINPQEKKEYIRNYLFSDLNIFV